MPIKALIVDWDGTLLDSFNGHPLVVKIKIWFFRHLPSFFVLAELAEIVFRIGWKMHPNAKELIEDARSKGILVGIATDRSVMSLIASSRAANFDIASVDFVHVRKNPFLLMLDRLGLVRRPIDVAVAILETDRFKGEHGALCRLTQYLAMKHIRSCETLLVGDDKRDVLAAADEGFWCMLLNRKRPDFSPVYRALGFNR